MQFKGSYTELGLTLLLDPARPGAVSDKPRWIYFPSNLYFPSAGCYTLTAASTGGSWTATFGFGS